VFHHPLRWSTEAENVSIVATKDLKEDHTPLLRSDSSVKAVTPTLIQTM
jgi:hypothetical protein